MLKGIDVSEHQRSINWNSVKNNIDFAILRCGYGNDEAHQDDKRFSEYVSECTRLKIPYAVYIYSYATDTSMVDSEVRHTLRLISGKNPFCVYYDMEENAQARLGKSVCTDFAKRFCGKISENGFKAGVYANANWFRNYLDVRALYNLGHSIWVAQYSSKKPNIAVAEGEYDMWQYSSSGKMDGVSSSGLDMNYMYNDIRIGAGAPTAPTPSPTPAAPSSVSASYCVRAGGKWLPTVTDHNDFAGLKGKAVTDVAIKVSRGSVKYRVHTLGGGWLPYVTGFNTADSANGFAGNGTKIDAIEIYYNTPDDIRPFKKAYYRVSAIGAKNYYPEQADNETVGGADGYAGAFGKPIDRLQIRIK